MIQSRVSTMVRLFAVFTAVLMVPSVFVVKPGSSSITGVQLPQSGDWDITSPTTVTDETITFHGNIIVESSLTLINTTLLIDCDYDGQFGIVVLSGGSLIVGDENSPMSNITSSNQYAYTLRIRSGAHAQFVRSEIHKCGYYSESIDYYSGICIETSDVLIQGCTISDNYRARP